MKSAAFALRQVRAFGTAATLVAAVACPAMAQPASDVVSVASAPPESERLVASVASGVVQVVASAYGTTPGSGLLNLQRLVGAGAIVDDAGLVLTSAELVADAMRVDVVITRGTGAAASERVVPAELVGIVSDLNLAVLRVDAAGVPALRLSRARIRPGDRTLTVAPGGPDGPALAAGVVLATDAPVREDAPVPYLITSAAQSVAGAPLFDEAGEVIGLAAAFIDDAGTTATAALPSALLQAALTQLTSPMPWQRGVVGLTAQRMMPVDDMGRAGPSHARLLVAAVTSGMPADKAGVRSGDVIVSVNDQPVNGMELATLYLALYTLRAGQPLHLGLEREGRFLELTPTAVSMHNVIASQ